MRNVLDLAGYRCRVCWGLVLMPLFMDDSAVAVEPLTPDEDWIYDPETNAFTHRRCLNRDG